MRVAILAGLLFAVPVAAQHPDSLLARRIDSVFAPVSRTSTPGCAVGVDRAGLPLFRRAYGMANLETGMPWSVGTISESGSVAKQFTAAALVLLARDGVLTLDDDIARWIPEARGTGKRITIRHLLTHTSGLPDRYTLHGVQGRPAGLVDHNNAEVVHLVNGLRELNFDPGEDYEYSNTGYVVAATVLERAARTTLQRFTSERIFAPLGMSGTRWREDHRVVVPGRASAYGGNAAQGFRNEHPFTRVIGSGGLLTTVDDFLRWQAALQRGDGVWGAVRDSLERVGRLNDGTQLGYALGVGVGSWRGLRSVSHTGSTGGYRAALSRYPDQQVAIALLCNASVLEPGAAAQRVATVMLEPALAALDADPAPIALDSAALARLAGAWHAPRTEHVLVLRATRTQLVDSTTGNALLIPVAPDTFRYRGSSRTLSVTRGPGGRLVLRVEAPRTRSIEYHPVPRGRPDARAVAALAGEYRSPELDARIRLTASGDTLRLERGWDTPLTLRPVYQDGFFGPGVGMLRFERGPRGNVTGAVLWAGRVRRLRFERVAALRRSTVSGQP